MKELLQVIRVSTSDTSIELIHTVEGSPHVNPSPSTKYQAY